MAELQIRQNGRCVIHSFDAPAPLHQLLHAAGFPGRQPCGGRGSCGKCAVTLSGQVSDPNAAELAAGTRLACQAQIFGDAEVFLPNAADEQIETATAIVSMGTPMDGTVGAAVDIGSTTVVVRRYDLSNGVFLGQAAMVNPQTSVAADVMSRIDAAIHGDLDKLQTQITDALQTLLRQAGGSADFMVITGNTTMLYLLTGRNPEPLSHAPFTADTLFDTTYNGAYLPPCMNAFVGADISCAVLASGMCNHSDTALLCDIGTNGEIALWKNGILYVTSTAAGPAFEGAGISCGCSSITGAIDRAEAKDGQLCIHTIGDAPAVGLCGSGLIDAIAALLQLEWMDETGALDEDFVELAPEVCLLQKDIRAVQLAKAAIAAGIATLLEVSGTSEDEIRTLYLAGGFGSHMNPESAAAIGLIPKALASRVQVLGNAALAGAAMLLLDQQNLSTIREIASNSVHLNLGGNPSFNEHYMEEMFFPVE